MTTVKVYSTNTCPYCFALKDWLDELGVEYQVFDASEKPDITVVPVTYVGEDGPFVGFDRPGIKKALKEHKLID